MTIARSQHNRLANVGDALGWNPASYSEAWGEKLERKSKNRKGGVKEGSASRCVAVCTHPSTSYSCAATLGVCPPFWVIHNNSARCLSGPGLFRAGLKFEIYTCALPEAFVFDPAVGGSQCKDYPSLMGNTRLWRQFYRRHTEAVGAGT